MGKEAYIALPMDVGGEGNDRREESSEQGVCVTFAKIGMFAALVSLVVVGGMHMSCGNQKTNQLRNPGKDSDLTSYWGRIHSGAWGPRHHHREGALPGPHHVPHGNMLGPEHHSYHDDEIPTVLRHPMHHHHGKTQAVKHVEHHPMPGDLGELKGLNKQTGKVIKHPVEQPPRHHNDLPNELRRHSHPGAKQNTVHVKKAAPKDIPDVEMPEILRHPPKRTNGNGKQGTYVVHKAKGRHHDEPSPRDSSDEWRGETKEEQDAKLDAELAVLEHDFNVDTYGEDYDEEEEEEEWEEDLFDSDEDDEDDEESDYEEDFSGESDDEEAGSESEDDAAYESEDEDEIFDEEDFEDEDSEEDELDAEILEALEEFDSEDMIVVEERLEEP